MMEAMNMRTMGRRVGMVVCGSVMLAAAPVLADYVSFNYGSLDGDFTLDPGGTTGTLTANASAVSLGGPFNSTGFVNRLVPVTNTAWFTNPGFVAGADSADFSLSLAVSGITGSSASGIGSIAITDIDGDVLNMGINGTFSNLPAGTIYFNGVISSTSFAGGDGLFEGSNGGSFSTSFPGPFYPGSVTQFTFLTPWLSAGSFADKSTLVTGTVVPAPAAVVLGWIGLGLVTALRRRVRR